jgi:hypothetical protein
MDVWVKIVKSDSECVCLYFFYGFFFMIKSQRIKKNLMFGFAHGKGL